MVLRQCVNQSLTRWSKAMDGCSCNRLHSHFITQLIITLPYPVVPNLLGLITMDLPYQRFKAHRLKVVGQDCENCPTNYQVIMLIQNQDFCDWQYSLHQTVSHVDAGKKKWQAIQLFVKFILIPSKNFRNIVHLKII